ALAGDGAKARALGAEGLVLADAGSDSAFDANARLTMGSVLCMGSSPDYEAALDIFERAKARGHARGVATFNRGVTLQRLGRFGEARDELTRALVIAADEQRINLAASVHAQLAQQAIAEARVALGREHGERALQLQRRLGDRVRIKATHPRLAELAILAADLDGAEHHLREHAALVAAIGKPADERLHRRLVGLLACSRGDAWPWAPSGPESTEWPVERGWAAWLEGHDDEARAHFDRASTQSGPRDVGMAARGHIGLGLLALAREDVEASRRHVEAAKEARVAPRFGVARQALAGLVAVAAGRWTDAEAVLGALRDFAREMDGPLQQMWVVGMASALAGARGEPDADDEAVALAAAYPQCLELQRTLARIAKG
ncbi:MAG: hypothetical protein AAF602_08335, partial [Myxococcota bacterium]